MFSNYFLIMHLVHFVLEQCTLYSAMIWLHSSLIQIWIDQGQLPLTHFNVWLEVPQSG